MFPFFLGLGIFGKWFDDLFSGNSDNVSNSNNNSYNPIFNINTWQPSDEILRIKGIIEGFSEVAYKRPGDPVTVGTGLTYFCDGSKPIEGRRYDKSFLNQQLKCVSKTYISLAKNLIKNSIVPANAKQADVIYYIFFNGFTNSRQENWKINHASNANMANWLFTRYGIGPNFLVGSDRRFFVGIMSSRFRLANYLMGRDINQGHAQFMAQFPKLSPTKYDNIKSVELYNAGKIKYPLYL